MNALNARTVLWATIAAIVAGGGGYVLQQRKVERANAEARALAAERDLLMAALERERATASQSRDQDAERSRKDLAELGRLRNEVAELRRKKEMPSAPASQPARSAAVNGTATELAAGKFVSKEQLTFAGFGTPEATLQSTTWAMMTGDFGTANQALSPEEFASELKNQQNDPGIREKYEEKRKMIEPYFKGIQILARRTISDDRLEFKVRTQYDPLPGGATPPEFMIQPMRKIGDEWKFGGSTRQHTADWDSQPNVQVIAP